MISRWHISWTIYNMVCIIGNYNWYYVILVDSHSNIFVWICEATMVLFFFYITKNFIFYAKESPKGPLQYYRSGLKGPQCLNKGAVCFTISNLLPMNNFSGISFNGNEISNNTFGYHIKLPGIFYPSFLRITDICLVCIMYS